MIQIKSRGPRGLFLADKQLSLDDITHPAGNECDPITAILFIGDAAKYPILLETRRYKTKAKIVKTGDPFEPSEWNEKITKTQKESRLNQPNLYFVQDQLEDETGKRRYEHAASGHFSLYVLHFDTYNDFLADTEAVYQFWLLSLHSNLCISADHLITAASIAHAFLQQSQRVVTVEPVKFSSVAEDTPLEKILTSSSVLIPETQLLAKDLTRRTAAIVEASYCRRYQGATYQNTGDIKLVLTEVSSILQEYVDARAGKQGEKTKKQESIHKLRLIKQQISFLSEMMDQPDKYPTVLAMLLCAALHAEHNLSRTETWEERSHRVLPTKKDGGLFVRTERRAFQQLLGLLGVNRIAVSKKAKINAQDVFDKLTISGSEVGFDYDTLTNIDLIYRQLESMIQPGELAKAENDAAQNAELAKISQSFSGK